MVQHFPRNVMRQTLHSGPAQNQSVASTETRQIAPDLVKTYSSNREGIMEVLLSQGFDPDTFDILIFCWRQEVTSSNSHYIDEHLIFSMVNNISPFKPPVQAAFVFLTSLIKKGKLYSQICIARSALASIITLQNNISFGNVPIVNLVIYLLFLKRIQLFQNTTIYGMLLHFLYISGIRQ